MTFYSSKSIKNRSKILALDLIFLEIRQKVKFNNEKLFLVRPKLPVDSQMTATEGQMTTNEGEMTKVWVATLFWVARTHLARPDSGAHAHVCAPSIWIGRTSAPALLVRLKKRSTFFQQFFNLFQQFFNIFGCSKSE